MTTIGPKVNRRDRIDVRTKERYFGWPIGRMHIKSNGFTKVIRQFYFIRNSMKMTQCHMYQNLLEQKPTYGKVYDFGYDQIFIRNSMKMVERIWKLFFYSKTI